LHQNRLEAAPPSMTNSMDSKDYQNPTFACWRRRFSV